MKSFQEQFVEARRASGLSQEQVAEKLNLSRPAVSHWETGRTLPDAETLKRLSLLLNYNFVEIAPAPANVPAEEIRTPAAPRGERRLKYVALGAVIGLIVGLLLGEYAFPRAFPAVKPVHLAIGSRETPVTPVDDTEYGAIWAYDVLIHNTSEATFTISEVVQKVIPEAGGHVDTFRYTPDDLRWADGVLPGGAEKTFSGGMPVQAIKEVRIEVSGTDQWGTPQTYEGVIELSKEMKE